MVTFLTLVFLITLPFGYWRVKAERFSASWYLAIHVPVAGVIGLRWALGLGWGAVPYSMVCFAAGQYAGGLCRALLTRVRGT